MYNCPQSCWRLFLLKCLWVVFSVLRSLSSWCINIKALCIYCQTMGTKVCIIKNMDCSWSHYPSHMFFNVCVHSCSFPLCSDWWKSDSSVDGKPHGNWRWNANSRDLVASSPSFSCPAARASWRACSQASGFRLGKWVQQ